MHRIYCQDLINRTVEITPEEVKSQLESHPEATKMFAALISLVDLDSDEIDLEYWEYELEEAIYQGVRLNNN